MPTLAALFSNVLVIAFAPRLFRWARGSLQGLVWFPDGRWLLIERNGREHEADAMRDGVFIGARWVALHWRCQCCDRQWRVAITNDNCDADARRRLIVRLRVTPDDVLFGKRDQFEGVAGQ